MQPDVMALNLKGMFFYEGRQFLIILKYPPDLLIYVIQTVKYAWRMMLEVWVPELLHFFLCCLEMK